MFNFCDIKIGKAFVLLQYPIVAPQPVFRKGGEGVATRLCDDAEFQIPSDQACLVVFFEGEDCMFRVDKCQG